MGDRWADRWGRSRLAAVDTLFPSAPKLLSRGCFNSFAIKGTCLVNGKGGGGGLTPGQGPLVDGSTSLCLLEVDCLQPNERRCRHNHHLNGDESTAFAARTHAPACKQCQRLPPRWLPPRWLPPRWLPPRLPPADCSNQLRASARCREWCSCRCWQGCSASLADLLTCLLADLLTCLLADLLTC